MRQRFRNRSEAGQALAKLLGSHANDPNAMVLALPRGGVPVGYEVAQGLNAPLDVFVVRKLGLAGHEEFAIGAIASGGVQVLNTQAIDALNISPETVGEIARIELQELKRREVLFRGDRAPLNVRGRTIILVDDGLATGSTMRAAIVALRQQKPKTITVAVPVAALHSRTEFETEADEFVCIRSPEPFIAVGLWYARILPRRPMPKSERYWIAPKDSVNHSGQRAVTIEERPATKG